MKYTNNMIQITVNYNSCVYEVRKGTELLDRVCLHATNMAELAQEAQKKAKSGCYGQQYYKQMFVCIQSCLLIQRVINKLNSNKTDEARMLYSYIEELVENSCGMNEQALWRMLGSQCAQWGATHKDTWEVLTKFCK